jgi:hypothetical protein
MHKPGPDNENMTIVASNTSCNSAQYSYKHCALQHLFSAASFARAMFTLPTKDKTTNSSTTQIFVMEGTPVVNEPVTTCPLRVVLADGKEVMSTHV